MKRLFLLLLLVCLPAFLWAVDIRVTDQASFDRLDADLKQALSVSPETIDIYLAPGHYYYRDKHLYLNEIRQEGTRIAIHGDGAVLLPALRPAASFDPLAAYFTTDAVPGLIRRRDPIRMARSLVRIVDKEKKICKLRVDEELPPEAARSGYIYLTEWYRGKTYKIVRVDGKQVYFQADDLYPIRFLYNVNLDFTFSFQFPRYRLVHCGVAEPEDKARQAEATTFLYLVRTRLGGLSCEGVSFCGNRYDPAAPGIGLVTYDAVHAPGSFTRCRFQGVRSDVFAVSGTADFGVEDCLFTGNYRHCLKAEQDCDGIRFLRNTVRESGLCGDNVYVVFCNGKDFLIQDNVISDYGYGGIYTGLYYATVKLDRVSGLISRNELFQTPEYFKNAPNTLLMDSGAIYIATQNDDVRIEDNYIHDIDGPTYNRGIFADDGASHIAIRRNRIENVPNHYALDVDPRSARKMLLRPERVVDEVHVGVVVEDNVVEGKVRIPKNL